MKLELIAAIRDHKVLYNSRMLKYKDIPSRNDAWDQVAASMRNMSVDECKTEWNKLRNCYVNALNRRISHLVQGKAGLPPWKYEEEMSFIKPFVIRGLKHSKTIKTTPLVGEYYDSDENITIEVDNLDEDVTEQTVERLTYDTITPKVERLTYDDDINMREYMIAGEENNEQTTREVSNMDETDLFFLGLSQTLKKLPDIEQCRLKMEIFSTVNAAEMKFLESRKRKAPSSSCSETE